MGQRAAILENRPMTILYIIDASNWAHASYHTGASLPAMIGAFRKRAKNPANVIAALDHSTAPTWRHDLLKDYKGGRKEKDDGLVELLGSLPDVFAAEGVRTVEAPPGHEADDVMATLAVRYPGRVALLTPDTDLIQVVSHRISLCRASRREERIPLTPERVRDRYGVGPEQWTDYLALVGKPSNGLRGVPGIGAKTAVALMDQYGDIEAILSRPVGMKTAIRKKLLHREDDVRLYKRLATLATNLELG